jgi:hypothetical protein
VNAASDIAVIRARLPYVDSRALSQAWFSALHRGADAPSPIAMKKQRPGPPPAAAPRKQPQLPATARTGRAKVVPIPARRATAPRAVEAPQPMRTAGAAPPPRPVAPTSPKARIAWHNAAFTVTVGEARVRILARSSGARLTLIAVCAARHAQLVTRAIAHASAGLREAGAFVNATVHCREES